jgi:hypothetical protein
MCVDGELSIVVDFAVGLMWVGKGKTIPVHTWTGPEVSRSLRLPDFETIGK